MAKNNMNAKTSFFLLLLSIALGIVVHRYVHHHPLFFPKSSMSCGSGNDEGPKAGALY